MNTWMGNNRKRWFMSAGARLPDHPTLADDPEGWARRRTLQNDHTGKGAEEWSLPKVFDPVFQAARVKHSKLTHLPIRPDAYGYIMRPNHMVRILQLPGKQVEKHSTWQVRCALRAHSVRTGTYSKKPPTITKCSIQ